MADPKNDGEKLRRMSYDRNQFREADSETSKGVIDAECQRHLRAIPRYEL